MERKKRTWSLLLAVLLGLSVLLMPVMAYASSAEPERTGTLEDVQEDGYTEQLEVSGNFDVTFSFVMKPRRGTRVAVELHLYDGDAATYPDLTAPNYLTIRKKSVYLYDNDATAHKDLRWSSNGASYGESLKEDIQADTRYYMNVRRWENKIAVKVTDDEQNVYWDLSYDAKTQMEDTLYLRLFSLTGSVTGIEYSIGVTESGRDVFVWSKGASLAVTAVIVVAVILVNWGCVAIGKAYFDGAFDLLVGGLWGIAVLVIAGLLVPAARPIIPALIESVIDVEGIVMPDHSSVWFWVILVPCVAYVVVIWVRASVSIGNNVFLATLLMLLLGTAHAAALYVIIAAVIEIFFIAIGVGVLLLVLGGGGIIPGGSKGKDKDTEEAAPKKEVKVWRENGMINEHLKVSSDAERYYDPDDGQWHKIK